jgi:hypothetical protein
MTSTLNTQINARPHLTPRRVARRPIKLNRRSAGGFTTIDLNHHTRPVPVNSPQTISEQALRLAIVRTPAFQGNALATAVSLAFPFGLALMVLDALGVAQAATMSPTFADIAPILRRS